MNATYNMDHLQAITHVSTLLNTGGTLGDAITISKPKTASTSHYDPAGTEVATVSNTSYEGVTFATDGSIAGGSLSHESSVPGGNKLSTTSVSFGTNGKPGLAEITAHNKNGQGDFKKIQMDMSGAIWNDSFAISAGEVKMTTTDATTGQKKHDGALQFDKEVVASGSFTHYAPDGSGSVSGYSKVDYSSAKFLGANIVGGQYAVDTHAADNALKSTSLISVSPLGQVQSIETTNMSGGTAAATAGVSSKVLVDFSKITFNARNEFQLGELEYTTSDSAGTLLSKTTVTYNNANPTLSTSTMYKNGQLQSKVVIDYAASQFNNDHQVVNSTKQVQTFSGDGKLLSHSVISYDQQGNKVKEAPVSAVQVTAPPKAAPTAVNNTTPVKRLVAVTGDGTTEKTDKKSRPDNTLEQMCVTTMQGDKPVFSTVTLYAADGTTVTKTYTMDLSGLSYDQNAKTVNGALNMQTHAGGNTLSAASTVQY